MVIKVGLDRLEAEWPKALSGCRVGLLVHPASVSGGLKHATGIFLNSRKLRLKAIFGPQHGYYGETQDNMVEWSGFRHWSGVRSGLRRGFDIPVYSLYGKTRIPTRSMLKDIDAVAVDLQDVGARYYTFVWSMELVMRACHEMKKSVVVLDRPNPIGGALTEGPVLRPDYASFVGGRPIPARHGLTVGEIGGYFRDEFYPSLDFHVIRMSGWRRRMWFDDTGLHWVMPSPNMPTLDTATVYPGMCLLEGTNLSEGRGTTRPFEIFGAPYIDPEELLRELKAPGVVFRPLRFMPAFQKFSGRLSGGLQLHVTDRAAFRPFGTAVRILRTVYKLYGGHFRWKAPPYEYEYKKLPIDILAGSDRLRKDIETGRDIRHMEARWRQECSEFHKKIRKRFLLYD